MANTKVSDLTAIVTPVDADEIHVAQSGSSLKMTLLQLTQYLDPDNIALPATTGGLVAGNVGDALKELQDEILDLDGADISFSSVTGGLSSTNVSDAIKEVQDNVGATMDHGDLTGLSDDDHSQYSLADGTRDFTGKVIGVDPTVSQHLATKNYVDSVIADDIGFTSATGGLSSTNAGDALRELQDTIDDLDAVDISFSSTTGELSSTNVSDALKEIADESGPPTKEMFFQVDHNSDLGDFRSRTVTQSGTFRYDFFAPHDFVELIDVVIIFIPSAGAAGTGKDMDFFSDYGAKGEVFNNHSESNTTGSHNTGTVNVIGEQNVSSVFSSLSANDYCGVQMDHNAIGGSMEHLGIRLRYR